MKTRPCDFLDMGVTPTRVKYGIKVFIGGHWACVGRTNPATNLMKLETFDTREARDARRAELRKCKERMKG